MELTILWRVFKRRWWIILLPVIVAAALAIPDFLRNEQTGAGGWQTTFSYSAAQTSSNISERDGDYQDVWLASEFVVNAFTDWVRSTSFRTELINLVGNEALLEGLSIAADNNRSIGIVYMSHPDELILTRLEDAAITVLQTRNQVFFPHLGDSPAEVTIINRPGSSPQYAAPTDRLKPLLQIGAALFAGIVLAGILEYFDNKLRYQDEVEALGYAVLARIPKHKS